MGSQRSSSAQLDPGPQRLPFAAAEALLWGPELKKQHQWLLQQMRALNTQHELYDTRIQMAEAVAEAAEAATARIRHMEQQITAMEAVDKENDFENWAMAEINQIKAFRDDNKNVRQKQIELGKEVAGLAGQVEKVKQVPDGLSNLATRVEFLESRQKEDADYTKRLEKEIAGLRNIWQTSSALQTQGGPIPRRSLSSVHAMTPPRRNIAPEVDINSETEDEDLFVIPKSEGQQVTGQNFNSKSPEIEKALNEVLELNSTTIPPARSARQRLFKRPSIHNSRLPRLLKEIQQEAAAAQLGAQTGAALITPATQLVTMSNLHKRQQPIQDVLIPRLTRSQARSPARGLENSSLTASNPKPAIQATQIIARRPANSKKRAIDLGPPPSPGKDPSKQPTQLIAASPRKKAKTTASKNTMTKAHNTSHSKPLALTKKREQLIVALPIQFHGIPTGKADPDDVQQAAAESSKASTRKSAPKARSCVTCSQRHRACDRAQPVCGSCARQSRGQPCVYPQPHESSIRSINPIPASHQKNCVHEEAIAGSSGTGKRITASHGISASTSLPVSPQKTLTISELVTGPTEPSKGIEAQGGPVSPMGSGSPEPSQATRRPEEAGSGVYGTVLDIKEFDTFLRTKRKNPRF